MSNNTVKILIIAITGVLPSTQVPFGYAYDNKTVHMKINEMAGRSPTLNLNGYIIDRLGFAEGIGKEFTQNGLFSNTTKKVIDWLSEGGFQEDRPDVRVIRRRFSWTLIWGKFPVSKEINHDPKEPERNSYRSAV
ncbi:MAG: hypothetical protein HGA96_11320 [Desulfobulbaceae bacterium]|nr:hypothetical protein [Desulfobulbaceae bacterium]